MDSFLYVVLPICLLGAGVVCVLYFINRVTRLWLLPKFRYLEAERNSLNLSTKFVQLAESLATDVINDIQNGLYIDRGGQKDIAMQIIDCFPAYTKQRSIR